MNIVDYMSKQNVKIYIYYKQYHELCKHYYNLWNKLSNTYILQAWLFLSTHKFVLELFVTGLYIT